MPQLKLFFFRLNHLVDVSSGFFECKSCRPTWKSGLLAGGRVQQRNCRLGSLTGLWQHDVIAGVRLPWAFKHLTLCVCMVTSL